MTSEKDRVGDDGIPDAIEKGNEYLRESYYDHAMIADDFSAIWNVNKLQPTHVLILHDKAVPGGQQQCEIEPIYTALKQSLDGNRESSSDAEHS
ncbi:hypothetical protein E2562_035773 [Oryza meyeriana var. granulata]|uniref:Uncharacterized protein n=1 Tax=Oryza meyeriana var. granulata TaxID=110450 RepID=A0A6G1FG77_9ORYZ|nr:hypothetical protein E2562_035773 [Oryza meyeriana var. granulata]